MAMGEVRWVDWGSNSFIPSLWLCGSTLEFWFRRKTLQRSLGWGGSVDWVLACELKGLWFNSQSGHMPGLQAGPQLGCVRLMFLSLSSSLPSRLSENKWIKSLKKRISERTHWTKHFRGFLHWNLHQPPIFAAESTLFSFVFDLVGLHTLTILNTRDPGAYRVESFSHT